MRFTTVLFASPQREKKRKALAIYGSLGTGLSHHWLPIAAHIFYLRSLIVAGITFLLLVIREWGK